MNDCRVRGTVRSVSPSKSKNGTPILEILLDVAAPAWGKEPTEVVAVTVFDRKNDYEGLKVGDDIAVAGRLRSHKWNEKWYTNLTVQKIERMSEGMPF